MQPTLFDPINDTTAVRALARFEMTLVGEGEGVRERERERNITTAMIKVKWD